MLLNKSDAVENPDELAEEFFAATGIRGFVTNSFTPDKLHEVIELIYRFYKG